MTMNVRFLVLSDLQKTSGIRFLLQERNTFGCEDIPSSAGKK